MKEIDLKLIYFSTFLALFGFFISFIMRDVIGSIVQYSLKSLTLALILSLVAKLWYNGMITLNIYADLFVISKCHYFDYVFRTFYYTRKRES
jgi:hypothetical protein